jgi:hypothetical protein
VAVNRSAFLFVAVVACVSILALAIMIWVIPLPGQGDDVTGTTEVPRPVNLAPSDGSTIYGPNVTLEWSAVDGADHYVVLVTSLDGGTANLNLTTANDRYDLLNTLTEGRYQWSVMAMDNSTYGPTSVGSSFTIRTSLVAPQPISPLNGTSTINSIPLLEWSASEGADTYHLQLGTSPEMADPDVDILLKGTSYQPDLQLANGTSCYWRIASNRESIWSPWSETSSFTFEVFLPYPVLLSPPSGTIITNGQVNITWGAVVGAQAYHLQMSNTSKFTHLSVDVKGPSTWYEPGEVLRSNTTYYWRVQCGAEDVWSGWSPVTVLHMGPENITFSYTWSYHGKTWTLKDSVPSSEYYTLHDRERTYDYGSYVMSDATLDRVATKLAGVARSEGYDPAAFVLSFVQSMNYTSDLDTTGQTEYPRYPAETLVDGGGDCEDKAALYASLMQSSPLDVDMVLLEFTKEGEAGHMAVGVGGDGRTGQHYTFGGADYYFAETTSPGWVIGNLPPELETHTVEIIPV